MIYRDIIEIPTEGNKFYDITKEINSVIQQCDLKDGLCNIFLHGTTAGLMINENDKMLFEDMRHFFESSAPEGRMYNHPENAQSHIKASMINQSLSIPVADNRLVLGAWQSILLWEFDVVNRQRKIIVTLSD
ncbi:MAG: secondary thiamine-phosphate synthase enzyme YjbQ [Candidatus Aenigmarchaeota archaeon]|nr:secondary thiamine-phosphate synthase enzyme YjbQ [Candidatus Aenigmarchaeota archaeon]